jgi:hypothetical protein
VDLTGSAQERFRELRERLLSHRLYEVINSRPRVARFMEFHVFAVWDFMSLLKRLQRDVTCVATPWLAPSNARLARMMNEITLGEETDEDGWGGFASHFELYLGAMAEVGADLSAVLSLIERLRCGVPYRLALSTLPISPAIRDFVTFHLDLACDGESHRVAAAFFYGREDLIPEMFGRLLPGIEASSGACPTFSYYVNRHIELDGDSHGPLARELLESFVSGDAGRVREAGETACASMERRLALWDAAWESLRDLS